jgi:hypothetical protein
MRCREELRPLVIVMAAIVLGLVVKETKLSHHAAVQAPAAIDFAATE